MNFALIHLRKACSPILRHSSAPVWRRFLARHVSSNQSGEQVMNIASNRATRFVYLRTLPLVKQPELSNDVDAIATRIEEGARSLCQKYSHTAVDDRAAVHLHNTSLAIATHRVLSPLIKNEIQLSNIIRSGFGATPLTHANLPEQQQVDALQSAAKKRPDFWIVRAALWFSFDRMAAVRKMTANMAKDFGSSFETSQKDADTNGRVEHNLFVGKYRSIIPCHNDRNGALRCKCDLTNLYGRNDSTLFHIGILAYGHLQTSATTTNYVERKDSRI